MKNINLEKNIIFEDNHLLVIYKEPNILSQEDYTHDDDVLTIYKQYLKEKYNKPGNVYLGLVHRLDRMTSGVMVLAKTSKAASRLSESIRNNDFHKEYICLVEGNITSNDTLTNYLHKDEKLLKSIVTNNTFDKLAVLDYEVIKNIDNFTLLHVILHTGRYHQIRCQLSNINHPLVGDSLYGSSVKEDLMLHCSKISFPHPITKEVLSFETLPKEEKWNKYL